MKASFRTAEVEVTEDVIVATFPDGARNEFHLKTMATDEEYRRIAEWVGYGDDWFNYGVDHELTHHWLADRLAWDWSWSLHDNPPMPWPSHISWEEHMVNQLQRQMKTGQQDKFGVLQAVFGEGLDAALADLRQTLEGVREKARQQGTVDYCRHSDGGDDSSAGGQYTDGVEP